MTLMRSGSSRKVFIWSALVTLCVKLGLSAVFPLTGDEAFFYQWGQYPDWGYADHPPMIGWWQAVLAWLGPELWIIRLPTVFATTLIGFGIVDLARRSLPADREDIAWLSGAVYVTMPWSWLFVLSTTDTPLVVFMALSVYAFVRAELRQGDARWYAASGLFIGLAFLSKYFAVLLGLAYLVYILVHARQRWWALPVMAVLALPSVGLHLAFNAHNGWANVMFNLVNRHGSPVHWSTLPVYLGMMLYLLTPWLVWAVRRASRDRVCAAPQLQVLWAIPFAVLLLLAFRRSIGLHWVLGFVPIFVLWAGLRLRTEQLRWAWKANLWLSLPHLLLVLSLVAVPLTWWQGYKIYPSLVFLREAGQITRQLEQDLPERFRLVADGYSPAAVLSYHHGRFVSVFGVGRHYARQDDLMTDFRQWDGAGVRVFSRRPLQDTGLERYFDHTEYGQFEVKGVAFYYLDGTGFRFESYRQVVLSEIADRFHRIPPWLPLWGSPFCERYGFTECAPGR